MAVAYEWITEEWKDGEITDTNHWPTYRAATEYAVSVGKLHETVSVALVRDDSTGSREWAYVATLFGKPYLPAVFADSWGEPTERFVPKRYQREFDRAQ